MTSGSSNDSTVPSPGAPRWAARPVSGRLPDFPWDALVPMGDRARAHPDGIVDLSVGTPVDPTPAVVRQALADASDSPGYPLTIGTPTLRASIVGWLERRAGAVGLEPRHVLPSVGSKELIAGLAAHLGLGPGDLVVAPRLAYPTYEVGAALAGARVVAADALTSLGPENPTLVWINSPSNPTGQVLPVEHLRKVVAWCRERGALLVSDECYLESGWEAEPVSVLHPDVCGGDVTGLLPCTRCPSGRTWPATGAPSSRAIPPWSPSCSRSARTSACMVPGPQQVAMAAALDDDAHVAEQRERYAARRTALRDALVGAGFRSTTPRGRCTSGRPATSRAGTPSPGWPTAASSSPRATSTGAAGARHVRVAFTATDERVGAAVARLG